MESILALLLALAMVHFQLSRGKQGCGEGSRLREMVTREEISERL